MRARKDHVRSKAAPANTRRRAPSKAKAFRKNSKRLKTLIAAAKTAAPSRRSSHPGATIYPLDMIDIAFAMTRARLERENPGASTQTIDRLLRAWGSHNEGAPYGDAAGKPISAARRSRILGERN